ncbi:SAM-dependent methyltransferase [Fodinicola acaciae]|uniref:SAM-dependent methyltransferase n=1 Tax=Fodinicola acaciae TaxID=2681555 RepID=UPI0013D46136|nr:SAM-dependent methyltransferase [Fodinicola acaciae]
MADGAFRVDTGRPNNARTYDYLLGGKDNFDVDRQAVAALLSVAPQLGDVAKDLRRWSQRAVRFLTAECGITQFLDCGSGLPTMQNTHQVAQVINPDARVVYVDNDPAVVVHSRVLLQGENNTRFVEGDLRRPDELLDDPAIRGFLELDQPIALIQVATIDYVETFVDKKAIMAGYVDRLASGSYVAMTHVFDPDDGSELSGLAKRIDAVMPPGALRLHPGDEAEIRTLFAGLELADPGLVPPYRWWPQGPTVQPVDPLYELVLSGVGRKA